MSTDKPKVVVVMPAYNAAKTLHMTYADLPRDMVDLVILVDDGSSDETAKIARELGLELFVHDRNYGYGANQKTCYREALRAGASIVVMVHPDYQYDPTLLPEIIKPIQEGQADVVFGSRLMGINPMKQGMPWWKYISNRFLTIAENTVFGLKLSEYHTGYRAFRREALESVNLQMDSDKFIFDQEIVAQLVNVKMRITEVPVPTRYFAQASSASFVASTIYGVSILWLLLRYVLHRSGVMHQNQFDSCSGGTAAPPKSSPRPTNLTLPKLSRKKEILLDFCLLFLYTAMLIRPYFRAEYEDKWNSIESTFISDAHFLVEHWPHPQWQPLWYTGTRFDYVYPPALRYGTAAVAKATGFVAAKAYHFFVSFFYALGIAGVYLLMRVGTRSAQRRGWERWQRRSCRQSSCSCRDIAAMPGCGSRNGSASW